MTGRRISFLPLVTILLAAGCSQRPPVTAQQPPLATQPTVGQEIGAAAKDQIEITFADGSARLSPDGGHQLDIATRLFRDVGPAKMFVIGHSDAQGAEFGNVLLSAQLARAVKQGLVARGIPPDRLYIQAVGESEPVSGSEPNAAANRRVVVKWQIL